MKDKKKSALPLGMRMNSWLRQKGVELPVEAMPKISPIPWDASGNYLKRIIRWIFYTRLWIFDRDWYFKLPTGELVKIPKGFIMDGASIPKLFRFLVSPVGILFLPGILHDYPYKYNKLIGVRVERGENGEELLYNFRPDAGKLYWDWLFRQTGYQVCRLYVLPFIAWLCVVCFGWFSWWKHRRAK